MAQTDSVYDRALWAAIALAKGATIACGIDALINHDSERLRGKMVRTRAFGYVGALGIVPLGWWLLPDRGRYPKELDLAVTIPLLLDAGGNALGMYEKAHIDDVVHVANSAIVAGVTGALTAPHVDERWQAALTGAGVAVAAETAWEIMEYGAWKLGAEGMDLTYEDSMQDLAEGFVGAAIGALFTLTRLPRSRRARKLAGWRRAVGA
jgi:hypothetical protein